MANKKKLKAKAKQQAKAGNLSSRLITRLESAGVKQSAADRIRNLNQAARRTATPSTSSTTTPSTPSRSTPEVKGLTQGLRIAGGGGGISSQELFGKDGLGGTTKKGPDDIIRRLDKINEKLSEKDKTGISFKSGAYNKLQRKVSKLNPFERGMLDFGTGKIGMQIASLLGDPGSPGAMIKGQRVGGRPAIAPTILNKGEDIGPKGKLQNRGVGKQYEVPKRFLGDTTTTDTTTTTGGDGTDTITGGDGTDTIDPVVPKEEVDTSLSSGAGGLDLASWATGFRRARSARQRKGQGAQGLASMKKSPFTSWYK